MSYKPGWKAGRWSAICDVCGFRYHSDALSKRWDGLMVCRKDYETRHPQEFLKARTENMAVPWARPEQQDTFAPYCTVAGISGYAGFAVAGCMVAGQNTVAVASLEDFQT